MRGGCPRPDRHRCPPPRWNIVSDTPPACGAVRAAPLVPRPEFARRTVPAIASAPERCQQQVRVPRPAPGAFPGCPSTADGPGPCALRRYWGGTIWLPPGGAGLTLAFGAHRTRCSAICLCRDVVRQTGRVWWFYRPAPASDFASVHISRVLIPRACADASFVC